MKLRLLPILIALVSSTVILFGGWFVYHSYAMENPLAKLAGGISGVSNVSTSIASDKAVFNLTADNNVDVRDLYAKIAKNGAGIIGNREIVLNINSDSSPELDKWWSSALFDVAQAMETRHYADIPTSLNAKAAQLQGLQVSTEMDDTNVYVRLTDGAHSKYEILPRVPAKLGVWPNE